MELGIFSSHITEYAEALSIDWETAAGRVQEMGITTVELEYNEWERHGLTLEGYADRLWAQGFGIDCIHRMCHLAAADDALYETGLQQGYELIDAAYTLAAPYVLIVPAFPEDINGMEDRTRARRRILDGLKAMIRYAAPRGVRVTIENFSRPQYPIVEAGELCDLCDALPGLGFTFDTGNFACVALDALAAYEPLFPYTVFFHAKDWRYTDTDPSFGGHVPGSRKLDGAAYGEGVVPLGAILDRLYADGYEGTVILEYNTYHFLPEELERSAAFLRAHLTERGE